MLEDDQFQSLNTGNWAMVSAIYSVLAKLHRAEAYVFSNSLQCLTGSSTTDSSGQFFGRWIEHRRESESPSLAAWMARLLCSLRNGWAVHRQTKTGGALEKTAARVWARTNTISDQRSAVARTHELETLHRLL